MEQHLVAESKSNANGDTNDDIATYNDGDGVYAYSESSREGVESQTTSEDGFEPAILPDQIEETGKLILLLFYQRYTKK